MAGSNLFAVGIMHRSLSPLTNLPTSAVTETRSLKLRLDSTLQELTLYQAQIDTESLGVEVVKIFEDNSLLPGIIIKHRHQLVGTISRQRFFEHMSRPYSLELFLKRPVSAIYQFIRTEFLIFPGHLSIVTAARESLQFIHNLAGAKTGQSSLLGDPIVVQISEWEYTLIDMHQLLLAQSQIHELTLEALWESQKALFEEKELAQVTLQSLGEAVIATDACGRIQSLNPVATKLTGWSIDEARGLPLTEVFKIINESTREPIHNPVEIVLKEGHVVGLANHTILIARDGQEFAIEDSAAPIRARNGDILGTVLVFRNVTQERQMAEQISWQASHDFLTGLPNRRQFENKLAQALSNAKNKNKQHILCYLDLDRFKLVNDTSGHLAGDEMLRQVTRLFQSQIRKTDILARLGGDEFGLLLYDCSVENAQSIANNLRDRLQEFRFVWHDQVFIIGVSIGLTAINSATEDSASALSAADAACYAAKNRGRNRLCIYQAGDIELVRQQDEIYWVGQIANALEENRFQLYQQAIAPAKPESCFQEHYEVLLRLIDEDGELVMPADFMPSAERYNLMPAIDRWIVRTLFSSQGSYYRQVWQDCQAQESSCKCTYAINLSGATINDEQFIDFLRSQFIEYQVPPQVICFEITETVAIANLNKAAQFIQELKQLGCRFALDDFGKGMSSFTYLKNLSVDYLKIDGAFVKEIVDDPIAAAMVEAIHRIGQVMGIKTIAEFVENEEIRQKVADLGVNYVQGYGIAQPTPLFIPVVAGQRMGEVPPRQQMC